LGGSDGEPRVVDRRRNRAKSTRRATANQVSDAVAAPGRPLGPPWGKDQKDAARAALIAFGTYRFALGTSALSVPK
jgi:hypothetical protein